jgi:hypothetical protein
MKTQHEQHPQPTRGLTYPRFHTAPPRTNTYHPLYKLPTSYPQAGIDVPRLADGSGVDRDGEGVGDDDGFDLCHERPLLLEFR